MGKITQDVKLRKIGDSLVISIPEPFRQHIDAEEGDMLSLVVEQGKYGNYVGVWNPKQQEE